MQWDKVKNILLVVLLLVDGFLGFSIASRYWDAYVQQRDFGRDLAIVLQRDGVTYTATDVAPQGSIIALSVDRDRAAEEAFSRALLTGEVASEIGEGGDTRYTGENGTAAWKPDGTVSASFTTGEAPPDSVHAVETRARTLLESAGVSLRGGTLAADADARTATLTATLAGRPVFDRTLTVTFAGDGRVAVEGRWTFGTPYAMTGEKERVYNVTDALLYFVRGEPGVSRIDGVELGYVTAAGVSGRIQLVPAWRVDTDRGERFVDALKKPAARGANIVD